MRVLKKAGNRETQGPGSFLSSQNLLEPGQRWGSCPSSTSPTAQPPHAPSSAPLQPASPRSHPDPHSPLFLTPKRLFLSCLTPSPLLPHFSPTLAPPGSFANSHTPPRVSSPPLWAHPSCLHCSLRGGWDEGTFCSSFCPPSWLEAIKGPDFSLCSGPRGDEQ